MLCATLISAVPLLSIVLPQVPRRAVIAAGPMALFVASSQPAQARSAVREGMEAFAAGKVEEAIQLYDSVMSANPASKPYLWQRGLALYYAERFADGAEQFASDVAVNPNDTEEQIWHLLCLAQVKGGLSAARPYKLNVGTDRRPVMRVVQQLFLNGDQKDESQLESIANNGDLPSRFYAALYLSLYFESLGDVGRSETWMREAIATDYARGGGRRDPMVELAQVAYERRGWSTKKSEQ